jgi:hypothetical protein
MISKKKYMRDVMFHRALAKYHNINNKWVQAYLKLALAIE